MVRRSTCRALFYCVDFRSAFIKDATGMSPIKFRLIGHFILSVVLLVAGFSNAFGEPVLKKVTLLLDWYPEAENAGYFYALTHGLYTHAGLDVQISPVGPNASVEPQVALGKYDFGLGSSDQVLIARSRGIPLVMVMGSPDFSISPRQARHLALNSDALSTRSFMILIIAGDMVI